MTDWRRVPTFGQPPPDDGAIVRPSAYALLADDAGRILAVRTPRGLFLPGGGIDEGETCRAAVRREVREECGLTARVGRWRVRAVDFVYSADERAHFEKRSTFAEAHADGPADPDATPEHEAVWLPPEEALVRLSHPSHRWAVARWRRRGGGA